MINVKLKDVKAKGVKGKEIKWRKANIDTNNNKIEEKKSFSYAITNFYSRYNALKKQGILADYTNY
jgi:hypothetical protein